MLSSNNKMNEIIKMYLQINTFKVDHGIFNICNLIIYFVFIFFVLHTYFITKVNIKI